MIRYTISAYIKFNETHKLKLTNDLCYKNPQGGEVVIQSDKNNDFVVRMSISAEHENQLIGIVEAELNRLGNVLCWNHRTQIIDSGISSISYSEIDTGKENIIAYENIKFVDSVSITDTLQDRHIKDLCDILEKNSNNEFEEILFMWREAIEEERGGLRFFLLYRILEWLNDGVRKNADSWIKSKEPNVEIRKDINNNDVTIYTFLRDNVHPKTINFPYEDIDKHISRFEQLVKIAINEKFG